MNAPFKQILSLLLIVATIFFVGCSSDDDPAAEVDKKELQTTIDEATGLINDTEEGTADGQYLRGSKAILQTAIDLAKQVVDSKTVTQAQVDNGVTALKQAITDYKDKKVTPIEPDALVGHWTFDETEGTTVTDYSGNSHTGTLKTGHTHWGAGSPEWVADRYGNDGKALKFDDGANVEIPYSTTLNPAKLSISLWVKADVIDPIWANNYMVSLNRWNGYKFQLQSANKAFMTVKADVEGSDDPAYYDRDNESPSLDQNIWYHVVATFGDGEMIFYINGTEVKKWDNTPGTAISIADKSVNLTIGQDLPTDVYTDIDGDDHYVNWGGYFIGTLDEVRIYNKVLSSTQVNSIYELEKP